jgi:putative chitinase
MAGVTAASGLKQITFHDNYRDCGAPLGVDLIAQSELLEQDVYAARSAGWFWEAHGCNERADQGDFAGTTRIINGPAMAGQDSRVALWDAAKSAFGLA